MKQFFRQVKQWASMNPEIDCILLVGSYARNTAKTDSDIDLVIISNHKMILFKIVQYLPFLVRSDTNKLNIMVPALPGGFFMKMDLKLNLVLWTVLGFKCHWMKALLMYCRMDFKFFMTNMII